MTLRLDISDRVARLTIDRPEKKNAITQAMWKMVPQLVQQAAGSARILLLQGVASGVFSAGADIAEFSTGSSDPAWRSDNQAAIRVGMTALAEAPIPTVALIEGDCVGGGCGLALCCDIRVAGPSARLGITPSKLGLVYSLEDTRRLVEAVGPSQAKRLLFTGELVTAEEAARIGLVTMLDHNPAAVVDTLVADILATSGHSQREAKTMVRRVLQGQQRDDNETLALFEQAFSGPDFKEGTAAFLERRQARFQ
jgi:enoyl-CoA hydratase/carnithine racemase